MKQKKEIEAQVSNYRPNRSEKNNNGARYPTSIVKIQNEGKTIHSTQKPFELLLCHFNESNTV